MKFGETYSAQPPSYLLKKDCVDIYEEMRGQLKLVICATLKKLTVTLLGLRSLPAICSSHDNPTSVCVKLSLIPDHEHKVPFKSAPTRVHESSASLHQSFSFSLSKRSINKRLLLSTWIQPNNDHDKSTFIGCMSFGIRKILSSHEVTQGWFYFLSPSLGRRKHLAYKVKENSCKTADRLSGDGYTKQFKVKTIRHSEDRRRNTPNDLKYECDEFDTTLDKDKENIEDFIQKQSKQIAACSSSHKKAENFYDDGDDKPTLKRRVSFLQAVANKENTEELDFTKLSIVQPISQLHKKKSSFQNKSPLRNGKTCLRRKQLSTKHPKLLRAIQLSNDRQKIENGLREKSVNIFSIHPKAQLTKKTTGNKMAVYSAQFSPCYVHKVKKNFSIKVAKIVNQPSICERVSSTSVVPAVGEETKFVQSPCYRSSITPDFHIARRKKLKVFTDSQEKETIKNVSVCDDEENANSGLRTAENPEVDNLPPSSISMTCSGVAVVKQASKLDIRTHFSSQSFTQTLSLQPNEIPKEFSKCKTDHSWGNNDKTPSLEHPDDVRIEESTTTNISGKKAAPNKPEDSNSTQTPLQLLASEISGNSAGKSINNDKTIYKSRNNFFKSLFSKRELGKAEKSDCLKQQEKYRKCTHCKFATASLSQILSSKDGIMTLRAFLVKEYSEENLDFWLECELLGREKSHKRQDMANKIYAQFLAPGSAKEINIDAETRKQVQENLRKCYDNPFDEACHQILQLLEKDSFPRFQKLECRTCDC